MVDGRKKNGGARPGAGRKTTAEILGLAELIDEAWPSTKQKGVIKRLADDCNDKDFHVRQESRKLLLAYKFGKPKEALDLNVLGNLEIAQVLKPKA